jgi:hypothetical protein
LSSLGTSLKVQTVSFTAIHDQAFPLSHYYGLSKFPGVILATQTTFQFVLFEEWNGKPMPYPL